MNILPTLIIAEAGVNHNGSIRTAKQLIYVASDAGADFCQISDRCLIGTGSQILQYKNLASDVVIGAGAVVTKNISESGVYVGAPAKKLR